MATLQSVGVWVLLVVGIGVAFSVDALAQEENISSSVVAAGAERSTGSGFVVSSTIGQASIGVTAGAAYQARIGFWYTMPQSSISAVDVQRNPVGENMAISVMPNPSSTQVVMEYYVREHGRVVIRLYNSLGRLVKTVSDNDENVGIVSWRIDVTALESGAYRIEVESANTRDGTIMTVVK